MTCRSSGVVRTVGAVDTQGGRRGPGGVRGQPTLGDSFQRPLGTRRVEKAERLTGGRAGWGGKSSQPSLTCGGLGGVMGPTSERTCTVEQILDVKQKPGTPSSLLTREQETAAQGRAAVPQGVSGEARGEGPSGISRPEGEAEGPRPHLSPAPVPSLDWVPSPDWPALQPAGVLGKQVPEAVCTREGPDPG